MKKLLILLTMILLVTVAFSQTSELEKKQQAIIDAGANWTAGENWVSRLSDEEKKILCNYPRNRLKKLQKVETINLPTIENLPSEFDWRDKDGENWATPVKDQALAGMCWAFSTAGQLESWWKIENSMPDSTIDLSESWQAACNDSVGPNDGYRVSSALDFIISQGGIPHEECFPYNPTGEGVCVSLCTDYWRINSVTVPDWGYVTGGIADVNNIKNAVYRHPLSASFTVYDDFMDYESGVYEHVYGAVAGGHAVLIVGWIDALECWIVKNSWATTWGEDGYFKIKWGECEFGEYSEFVYNDEIFQNIFTISENEINVSLASGDSTERTITYTNTGNKTELEYSSTVDYSSSFFYEVPAHFHVDTDLLTSEKSWWCGDPATGGYGDHWLDYLDSPIIDISSTTSPTLKFKGKWAMEDSAGAIAPYDGWDGCNVWISTDGGENFSVIDPTLPNPYYECAHMWSFGHPSQGYNMGTDIAAWPLKSNADLLGNADWVDVEFDLSSYKSDNTVIRFALASDMAFSVADDATLKGFYVDNIDVSDGETEIFSDACGDGTLMTATGWDITDYSWLTFIEDGTGTIPANSSEQVTLKINTKNTPIGNYTANIPIKTNDNQSLNITCNLEVTTSSLPKMDEGNIVSDFQLKQNYPNPFNPITNINYSINSSQLESVKLVIYDLLGKKVDVLVDKMQSSGNYKITLNGNDYSSGIYFYKLTIGNSFSDTKKMVFLR